MVTTRPARAEDAPLVAALVTQSRRDQQYSFVKPLDASGAEVATRLVPRVEPETR